MRNRKKKIALITGGCGLLGWEHAAALSELNFKIIVFKESINSFTGETLSSGRRIIPIPKNSAKKITWSIFLLLVKDLKMLSGTISSSA